MKQLLGLALGSPQVMLGLLAVGLMSHTAVYFTGRGHEKDWWQNREVEIAAKAVEEYKRDNEEQAESGLEDRQALRAIDHKLNQFLEERPYVSDGRTCIEPADTQRMQLDYDAVFEKRLQARRELDGAE